VTLILPCHAVGSLFDLPTIRPSHRGFLNAAAAVAACLHASDVPYHTARSVFHYVCHDIFEITRHRRDSDSVRMYVVFPITNVRYAYVISPYVVVHSVSWGAGSSVIE